MLFEHLTQPQACEVQDQTVEVDDPENGISETVKERLVHRGYDNRVNTWQAIWRLLFPNDPDDCIPHQCTFASLPMIFKNQA